MAEKDIKIKVIEYLLSKKIHDVVIPEVTVGHKSLTNTQVRADIFALNGDISIYEIKSEKDTLIRLQTQLASYKQYANRVSVVVATKFLSKLDIDHDIGIYEVMPNGIKEIRPPSYHELKKDDILEYWLSNELKDFLFGYKGSSKMNKKDSIEFVKSLLSDTQIYNATLYMLKGRYKKESSYIKEFKKFPKRGMQFNSNVVPLKKLPFGLLTP
jgi:hypothetical protein